MKKKIMRVFHLTVILLLLVGPDVFARPGNSGYEGGVAAEMSGGRDASKMQFRYQEVLFLTGKPIILDGTMTLTKKSSKTDGYSSTYQYTLSNVEEDVTLTRTIELETSISKKGNGQVVEQTSIAKGRKPSEIVRVGSETYTLTSYDSFTRSVVIDNKPAVNYFAGEILAGKTYRIGAGVTAATSKGTIKVRVSGDITGYDQYWGSTETQSLQYVIQSEQKKNESIDSWGGTADVNISTSMTKQIRYDENQPSEISFDGKYVMTAENNSVMEYRSKLPEFTSEGISTDRMLEYGDSLKVEVSPSIAMLMVPNLSHIKGHWADRDIELLFALEVFRGSPGAFDPEEYMTRAEFADAVNAAAKEVPPDPALTKASGLTSSRSRKGAVQTPEPVFEDVPGGSQYLNAINSVFNRKLMTGTGTDPYRFDPDGSITVAQALTIFINALGLENMAQGSYPVTGFRDNDEIPEWARSAVYAAERIGLAAGDERGYLGPNEPLTKGRAAKFINQLIDYMRKEIVKDYRDRIIRY